MIKSICVYCASSTHISEVYNRAAEELGTLIGRRGLNVINGGGGFGLMRIVSDAAINAGGTVTGVIPHFMVHNGWCHPNLTEIIKTETMHERKQTMADMSDGAITLPGGVGTLEELLEIITWRQLGLYKHPLVILNTNHYYDPLLEMFRKAQDEKFMIKGDDGHNEGKPAELWKVADTPSEALDHILQSGL